MKCPFCNSGRGGKTVEVDDGVKEIMIMKRVEANDSGAISVLAHSYWSSRAVCQQKIIGQRQSSQNCM
jgi:hypothetical protein